MTVLFPYCDAMMRGSPALRERIYPLILDVEPAVSAEMNISPRFNMLLDGFKCDAPYSYDEVQIDYKVLSAMCSGLAEGTGRASVAKKVKTSAPRSEDDDWPNVHQEAYSFARVDWPPDTDHIDDFLPREAEIVYLANAVFPVQPGPDGDGQPRSLWEFMDANHSLERTLRFPPARCGDGFKPLRNPWKPVAPTFTAGSKIAARKWRPWRFGDGDPGGFLELKRLHPLELMAMNGWGVAFWKDPDCVFSDQITPELISDMAGNMWNGWSYMCMEMALAGCCNWTEASERTVQIRFKKMAAEQQRKTKQAEEHADEGVASDNSSDASSVYVPAAEFMAKDALSDEEL